MSDRMQRVRLETERHAIEGNLQLPAEGFRSRVKDFLNAHTSEFIALTDAVITPVEGEGPSIERPFLAVSTRHVVLLHEVEAS